jgi:hypothetical protein
MKHAKLCMIGGLCCMGNAAAALVHRNPFAPVLTREEVVIASASLPLLDRYVQFVMCDGEIKISALNKKPLQLEKAEGLGG